MQLKIQSRCNSTIMTVPYGLWCDGIKCSRLILLALTSRCDDCLCIFCSSVWILTSLYIISILSWLTNPMLLCNLMEEINEWMNEWMNDLQYIFDSLSQWLRRPQGWHHCSQMHVSALQWSIKICWRRGESSWRNQHSARSNCNMQNSCRPTLMSIEIWC